MITVPSHSVTGLSIHVWLIHLVRISTAAIFWPNSIRGRVSLIVALIAVVISLVIGAVLGAVAGYFGGIYDTVIMRVIDIIMSIPGLLLAVAISAALGTGLLNTGIAVGLASIPGGARILRSTVMTIRDEAVY